MANILAKNVKRGRQCDECGMMLANTFNLRRHKAVLHFKLPIRATGGTVQTGGGLMLNQMKPLELTKKEEKQPCETPEVKMELKEEKKTPEVKQEVKQEVKEEMVAEKKEEKVAEKKQGQKRRISDTLLTSSSVMATEMLAPKRNVHDVKRVSRFQPAGRVLYQGTMYVFPDGSYAFMMVPPEVRSA